MSDSKEENTRRTENKIDPIFVNRWSPRCMTGEEITDDDLTNLFEAARGLLPLLIINLGDLFIQKERQGNGPNFWTY